MLKKGGIGCAGLIALIVVILVASQLGGGKSAQSASSSSPVAQAAVPTAAHSAPTVTAPTATVAKPTVTPVPPKPTPTTDPNGSIVFGKPLVQTTSAGSFVEVLATNSSGLVKSFTVKATYLNGDKIVATADGAVNDILPGQKRAVNLLSTDKIPAKYSSVRVDVDTLTNASKSTDASDVVGKIKFGPPTVKSVGGLGTVNVEVTNGDSTKHSFTVEAVFLQGGTLVGDAEGAVNDLAPGQTKTASLLATGSVPKHDQTLVEIDTLVK